MDKKIPSINQPAQDFQDQIFQSMSADQKLKFGSELWQLAKGLVGHKINYASNKPTRTARRDRQNP